MSASSEKKQKTTGGRGKRKQVVSEPVIALHNTSICASLQKELDACKAALAEERKKLADANHTIWFLKHRLGEHIQSHKLAADNLDTTNELTKFVLSGLSEAVDVKANAPTPPKLWIVCAAEDTSVANFLIFIITSDDKDESGEPAMTADIQLVLKCVAKDAEQQNATVWNAFSFLFFGAEVFRTDIEEKEDFEPQEVYDAACRILPESKGKYKNWHNRFNKTSSAANGSIEIPAFSGLSFYIVDG